MEYQALIAKKCEQAKQATSSALTSAEQALDQGFDSKTAQKSAMEHLRRAAEAIQGAYKEAYFAIAKTATEAQQDFYYGFPDLHVWKQKHVDAANQAHPSLSELTPLMTNLAAMREKLKAAPVVKHQSKAEAKAVKLAEPANAGNLAVLRTALVTVRDDVIAQYVNYAINEIARFKAALEKSGWNINAAFKNKENRQNAYRMFKNVNGNGDCQPDEAMEAARLASFKRTAEDEFEAFIAKMVLKLGDRVIGAVTYHGQIWEDCQITIDCQGGEQVVLKTKIILNTSKNGKLFNQWPTRVITG